MTTSHVYQSNERNEKERTIETIPSPSIPVVPVVPVIPSPTADHFEHDGLLIAMATNRIRERKQFLVHSIMFLPVSFFILLASLLNGFNASFFVLTIAVWGIGYGAHGIKYAVTSGKSPSYPKGSHRAKEIADEVAMIKSYLHH